MLTVASVPAAHPYVRTVVDADDVALLPDPVPRDATLPGQWWPPRLLEPDYLRGRLDDIDVMHVHFGFDTSPPDQLGAVVDLLDGRGVPLVLTVHDLQNPHFTDQSEHHGRLDVLVPAADTVITLTHGAAAEIHRRWGREAVVVPHPHVLPLRAVGARRERRDRPVVGIHAKSLRANVDPWPLLAAMIDHRGADWQLRLDLDDDVLGAPRSAEASARRLDRYRRAGVDVRMHPRFTDREMVGFLSDVDVLVVPYRHGTHSGWVEACHDAGVHAVVPDCGYFHQQQQDASFHYGTTSFSPESLVAVVEEAVGFAREQTPNDDESRRKRRAEQRRSVREVTSLLYRSALRRTVDPAAELSA